MKNSIEVFAKIRWAITFIEEEVPRVAGSDVIKEEIIGICSKISTSLGKIGEVKDLQIATEIKKELDGLDSIVHKIDNDTTNQALYYLLISHIADIRFLFLSKKEQERILKRLN